MFKITLNQGIIINQISWMSLFWGTDNVETFNAQVQDLNTSTGVQW